MDLRMYILVNEDIEINKGKLAGQVGHAVAVYFYNFMIDESKEYDSTIELYMTNYQKKIILYAPQSKLEELEVKGYIAIRDRGWTDLEPNTLTCINMGIIDYDDFPKELNWLKNLKLCR